jgi:hypothetical protein
MANNFEGILDGDVEEILSSGSTERCENYVPDDTPVRSLTRELREGNPAVECLACEGYDCNCPAYQPRK